VPERIVAVKTNDAGQVGHRRLTRCQAGGRQGQTATATVAVERLRRSRSLGGKAAAGEVAATIAPIDLSLSFLEAALKEIRGRLCRRERRPDMELMQIGERLSRRWRHHP